MKYTIEVYQTKNGKLPFNEWLMQLDIRARQKIRMRLNRLCLGNFGNCKALKDSVYEIKLDFGPGYRIYFAQIGQAIIIILKAGTKRTQKQDIQKAKEYLQDYQMRGKKYDKK